MDIRVIADLREAISYRTQPRCNGMWQLESKPNHYKRVFVVQTEEDGVLTSVKSVGH